MLTTIVIVIDVIAALFLILTILLHSGRGAGSRHVRWHVVAVGWHSHGTHPRPPHGDHRPDLRLCTFYLAWQWNP